MMEFITFVEGKPMEEMYEYQRYLLTELSDVNPVFWHESLIAEPTLPDGSKCWLYSPPPEKLNASIMLSLSFGAKGVFFWMLTSTDLKYEVNCNSEVWYKNILDENYLPNEPLDGYIKNDLSPRMNGVLGSTDDTTLTYTFPEGQGCLDCTCVSLHLTSVMLDHAIVVRQIICRNVLELLVEYWQVD